MICVPMAEHNDDKIKYSCIGLMLLLKITGIWYLLMSDVLRSSNLLEIYKIKSLMLWLKGLNTALFLRLLLHSLPAFPYCVPACCFQFFEMRLQNIRVYYKCTEHVIRVFPHLERNTLFKSCRFQEVLFLIMADAGSEVTEGEMRCHQIT